MVCKFLQIFSNLLKIFNYLLKKLCMSGLTQFKPMLFRGQLYSLSAFNSYLCYGIALLTIIEIFCIMFFFND